MKIVGNRWHSWFLSYFSDIRRQEDHFSRKFQRFLYINSILCNRDCDCFPPKNLKDTKANTMAEERAIEALKISPQLESESGDTNAGGATCNLHSGVQTKDKGGASKSGAKMRQNYFFAVRVINDNVNRVVDSVQRSINAHEPRYQPCCYNSVALHVTLCTVALHSPAQLEAAVQVLQINQEELKSIVSKGTSITLKGVSNFSNRVIYAKVEYPSEFLELVNRLKRHLKVAGVDVEDTFEYEAHMTIMKVTYAVSKQLKKQKFDARLFEEYADTMFGAQTVDGICLCAMGKERRADGFYVTPTSVDFGVENQ